MCYITWCSVLKKVLQYLFLEPKFNKLLWSLYMLIVNYRNEAFHNEQKSTLYIFENSNHKFQQMILKNAHLKIGRNTDKFNEIKICTLLFIVLWHFQKLVIHIRCIPSILHINTVFHRFLSNRKYSFKIQELFFL